MDSTSLITKYLPEDARNPDGSWQFERLPWYRKDMEEDYDSMDLFKVYSKLPADEIVPHVTRVRDKAFQLFPYPCLGYWRFLDLSIGRSPQYQEVLKRIKDGESFLDLGCCVGQDIRKLVYDGAPSDNLYGSDIEKGFLELGYDLFLDKSTLKATFIPADIFDADSGLKQLDGKLDIIHTASFFHLFDWDESIRAAKRIIALFKPQPGVLLLGRQAGNIEPGLKADKDRPRYRHNADTWKQMWKQIGEETGTSWEVEAHLADEDLGKKTGVSCGVIGPGSRFLTFTVRRL